MCPYRQKSDFLSIPSAVPEDGVYTFHGPEELVTSKQEPGYSLRLFVGQEQFNSRNTGPEAEAD